MIDQLQGWARDTIGSNAHISNVCPMPGNSGYSFGFDVRVGAHDERLVIRMPPPGATIARNSDVLRQARILAAMHAAGIPVPEVRWSEPHSSWFDAPYYVAEFVEGRSTHMFDPAKAPGEDGTDLQGVFADGMRILAGIHQVDWQARLPGWSEPVLLTEEIEQWLPTLHKAENQEWIRQATALADELLNHRPEEPHPTVVHGDYYSNNWLFRDGRLTAVLDWEIAAIGSAGLDLGWICMMYDRPAWGGSRHQWEGWTPSPDFLVECYEQAGGRPVQELDWYRSLAGYRLACITARAHALHRTGKRHDPAWEVLADSFTPMIVRGFELLGSGVPRGVAR